MQDAPEIGSDVRLPAGEEDHLFKVLRAREGDAVEVVGGGGLFLARVHEGRILHVVEEIEAGHQELEITLYQAVPKGARMDLVVEKATEVGVTGIVPLLTEHGEVDPRGTKVERWRRVARSAARQSLRLRVPEVSDPMVFREALEDAGQAGVLLHDAPDAEDVEGVVGSGVGLFVGPEGGWNEGEVGAARDAGFTVAGLGPYRLRSETAGIVAVARARAALEKLVGVEGGA